MIRLCRGAPSNPSHDLKDFNRQRDERWAGCFTQLGRERANRYLENSSNCL
ncbi:hypothetical protein LEMLEM_LOCUS8707 [Lemmus lemmus]